ncbi:MAG: Methionyl-tRNA synthetase, partial [uncultured Pseudonocardia sp.]
MTDRHILTAVAWPYANGPRHIGHVSGFGVPSDVFSRYHRMAGDQVLMVSGTDEHGTPITVAADAEGVSPREIADRNNRIIVGDLQALGLSYDLFTRTTTANHAAVSQEIFLGLLKNGYVFPQTTLGAISPSTGRTLPDRYIEGTCPICGYHSARGDQCDNCGNQLDPTDLINPVSRINGETPKFVESEHYFLDLPAFTRALGDWLGTRRSWRPNVLNFSVNLLADLKPRSYTRDIDWGVRVPLDGWRDRSDKRIYVWFDAVVGYLSASIEWARRSGDPEAWRQWWQTPDAGAYYFMGKDNIVFHSEIWPAQLLGYNGEGDKGGTPGPYGRLNLPTEVVSSEFLTMEGRKFSSSRQVVIYVRDFLARYDADALRYFIAVAGPENQDTDFTWTEFRRRNNDELVAGWGNLVNRSVSMAAKNVGAVPTPGDLTDDDRALLAT